MAALLAVDLGVRAGLALYGRDGRLRWYRSRNFGSAARLRKGVHGLLGEIDGLTHLVLEGGGPIAEIWEHEARRRQLHATRVAAEQWRQQFLYARQQRTGRGAKHCADELARRVIDWSGARRPTSLRHDAAEAILIGLWGVITVGWLDRPPIEIHV
jgi:hypothetical protein